MFRRISKYLKKFNRERYLIIDLNRELRKLKKSVNNRRKILLESRHILYIISRLEKTDIYWFINDDISRIKNYIKKLMKNPRNKGIIYIITSIYIVAPGTFEATGIILFFRYIWRYIFKKRKAGK